MSDIRKYIKLIESHTNKVEFSDETLIESSLISKIKSLFMKDKTPTTMTFNDIFSVLGKYVEEAMNYDYFVRIEDGDDMNKFINDMKSIGFKVSDSTVDVGNIKPKLMMYGMMNVDENSLRNLNKGVYQHPPMTAGVIAFLDEQGYLYIYAKGMTDKKSGQDYDKEFTLLKP